jgi:uncharacterized protein YdhG (YjbR/CyaY superfamily)
MARTDFKSVDEYIATHPADLQAILQRVRSTIRKAVPGAEEVISYQIPTYRLHGGYVVYFAGWKEHYSLYPATAHLVAALKDDLAPYEVGKGTIRFPLSQPVPVKLIGRIAKFLAKEAAERAKAKLAGPRKRRVSGGAARLRRRTSAKPRTIDDYLAGLSVDERAALEKVRVAIRSAAPEAEECISYGIPAFRLNGRVLVAFKAAANHCAFHPMSGTTVAAHKVELAGYDTSPGTIRFQPTDPLPARLIRKLVRARIAENLR